MDDSWQDAALSNRHLHNRTRGRTIGAGGKSKSLFDVRRIFGTYELKCAAAEKKASTSSSAAPTTSSARLEVHGLNDGGNAVYAEMVLPGVLHAVCILAGSRKGLSKIVEGLIRVRRGSGRSDRPRGVGDDDDAAAADHDGHHHDNDESDEDNDDEEEDEDEDELENSRAQQFEKNSFRSPKFWMKWQGRLLCPMTKSQEDGHDDHHDQRDKVESGMAYLVFSGNSCDKFEGTLSCDALDWRNVKIKGWNVATKPQRDFAIEWQDA